MVAEYAVAIGTGSEQCYFIQLAKELGFKVIGFDKNPKALGVYLCDDFYCISTSNASEIISVLKDYKISLVIPSPIGKNLTTIGAINDYFSIMSFSSEAASNLVDKFKFYKLLDNLGLNSIESSFFDNLDSFFASVDRLSYPFIVKPIKGSGSRGILVVEDKCAFERWRGYLESSLHLFETGLLVQDYVSGLNLGVDGLFLNKELIDVTFRYKFLTPLPFRVEYAYFAHFELDFSLSQDIIKAFEIILRSLNVHSCVFHADIVITRENRAYIIEMSLRPSGMSISSTLLPNYLGKNYAKDFMIFTKDGTLPFYSYTYLRQSTDSLASNGEAKFLIEHLYHPSLEGKIMLCPTLTEVSKLDFLQEIGYSSFNRFINFDRPTSNHDVLKNGYVVFKCLFDKIDICRLKFYSLFNEVSKDGYL